MSNKANKAKALRRLQHAGPFPPKPIPPRLLKKQERQERLMLAPHPSAFGQSGLIAGKTSLPFLNRRCVEPVKFEDGLVFRFGGCLPRHEDGTIFNPPSCSCSRGWHRRDGYYRKDVFYYMEFVAGLSEFEEFPCCSRDSPCIESMKNGLTHVPRFESKHRACVAHQGLATLQGFKTCITNECAKVVVFGPSGRSRHCIEHLYEHKQEKDPIWQGMTEQAIPNHWLIPVPLKDDMKFLLEGRKQTALGFSEEKWRREEASYQIARNREITLLLKECVIPDIAKMIEGYLQ